MFDLPSIPVTFPEKEIFLRLNGNLTRTKLSAEENRVGFILPNMEKNELFETVIADGALPRKTFSMGEAHDKKFYMECKKIK